MANLILEDHFLNLRLLDLSENNIGVQAGEILA
jgi:hypothetical protein